MLKYSDKEKELILNIAELAVGARLKNSPFGTLPYASELDAYHKSKYVMGLPPEIRDEFLEAVVSRVRVGASGFILRLDERAQDLLRKTEGEMLLESLEGTSDLRFIPYRGDPQRIKQCVIDHMSSTFPEFVRNKKGEMVSMYSGHAIVFSRSVNGRMLYVLFDQGTKGKGRITVRIGFEEPHYTVSLRQFFGLSADVKFHDIEGCTSELGRVMGFMKVLIPEIIRVM